MLSNRQLSTPLSQENPLWVSWHDTQMMASLTAENIMDYFCRKSNPFYDRMCNNENIRMQRLGLENLINMVGVEYILLHVHEPILFVIRKQHRHNPNEATPIADYYIVGGMVYKAPDLANVINSRILSAVTNLQLAFEEASSYSRYHPNKGYTWDFSSNKALSDKSKKNSIKEPSSVKEDGGTIFQMQRVDILLAELLRKFPPPLMDAHQMQAQSTSSGQDVPINPANIKVENTAGDCSTNGGGNNYEDAGSSSRSSTIIPKQEPLDMKPPPEKKMKYGY